MTCNNQLKFFYSPKCSSENTIKFTRIPIFPVVMTILMQRHLVPSGILLYLLSTIILETHNSTNRCKIKIATTTTTAAAR